MQTDWIEGAVGGAMIGAAAAAMLLLNGRIMGASGILGGLIARERYSDWIERVLFLLGMLAAAPIFGTLGGPFALNIAASPGLLVLAGFLVGLGTRIGGGCTSGHGVCGLPRGARRSWVAVPLFMGSAIATVTALQVF